MKDEIKEKCVRCKFSRQCVTAKQINSNICLKDNEEIKEILDRCTPFLFGDEVDRLSNYITNLQTIEQQYSALLSENAELQEKLKKYEKNQTYGDYVGTVNELVDLQEENEKVHKDFDELSERYFFTKSRNEKAIAYIGNGNLGIPRKVRDKFIAILQGSDK